MDDTGRVLSRAHELAVDFIRGLDDRPVWPRASYEQMLAAFDGELPAPGADPSRCWRTWPGGGSGAGRNRQRPRFFGFVIGGSSPPAWAATSSPVAGIRTPVSSRSLQPRQPRRWWRRWIVDVLGLPTGTAVGFVTGGMMANYTCLSAARHAVLARPGWDVVQRGLFDAPRVRVVVGRDRHDTVDRAVRYLGLGQDAVTSVDSDDEDRVAVPALESALADGQGPTIVCLQAGEVHTGAFDDFAAAIPAARQVRRVGARRRRIRALGRGQPDVPAAHLRPGRRRLLGNRCAQDPERSLRLRPGDRAGPRGPGLGLQESRPTT